MHNTIADRRNRNCPPLCVSNFKKTRWSRPICSAYKLIIETEKILFKTVFKLYNLIAAFLSFAKQKPAVPYIL
jgi:hypothetical protein